MGNGAAVGVQHEVNEAGCLTSKYKVGALLGAGSFGQVFEVTSLSDPSVTGAMKVAEKQGELQDFWSDVAVFYREVAIVQSLEHGNVVKFWDSFDEDGRLFLVTELCAGGQVFEQIASLKRFHETDAALVVAQMLLAIKYIHAKCVMHRDIKAESFMFSEPSADSAIKMIDFGMSSTFEAGDMFHEVCGSRFYVAPEMLKQKYDHRIDMWALGVLTYLLCHGQYPFKTKSTTHHADLYRPLQWRQKVPLSVETKDFIQSVLQPDPDERLTAKEALAHPFVGYPEEEGAENQLRTSVSINSKNSLNSNLSESIKQAREVIRATKDDTVTEQPRVPARERAKRAAKIVNKDQSPQRKEATTARVPGSLAKIIDESSGALGAGMSSPKSSGRNANSLSLPTTLPMRGSIATITAEMGGCDRQVSKDTAMGGRLDGQVPKGSGSTMYNSKSPARKPRTGSSSDEQRVSTGSSSDWQISSTEKVPLLSRLAPTGTAHQQNHKIDPLREANDGTLSAGKPRKLQPLAMTPLMPDLPGA